MTVSTARLERTPDRTLPVGELVFAGDTAVGWASLGSDPAELLRRALAVMDA